ncbi:MAG: hypothetical protein ACREBF_04065 [Candidatus Micrarchaeales archaeon]
MKFHIPKPSSGGMPRDLQLLSIKRDIDLEIALRKSKTQRFEGKRKILEEVAKDALPGVSELKAAEVVSDLIESLVGVEMNWHTQIEDQKNFKNATSCVGEKNYFDLSERANVQQ